ncbi:MAG: flavin reductase family protein [Elusimicrobia bacterium]|nr:flavin reductase family protein [Elusimicrobiota bacterium]
MHKNIKPASACQLINHSPVVLVTTVDKKGDPNIMTLAWTTMVNTEPPLLAIVIGQQAYSQKSIKETKEFVLNIPDSKLMKSVLYCGSTTGKNTNKFEKTGLTQIISKKVKAPKIKECFAHVECKVIKEYKYSDVMLFIAKIVYADADNKYFDGYLKTDKIKTIHHLGGGWFAEIGKRFKV